MNRFSQLAGFWKHGIRRAAGVTILLAGALLTSAPAWAACDVSLVTVFTNGQAVLKANCGVTQAITGIQWFRDGASLTSGDLVVNVPMPSTGPAADIHYTTTLISGTHRYTATGNSLSVPAGLAATITTGQTALHVAALPGGSVASTSTPPGNPANISCTDTVGPCEADFPMGTIVTLTPVANSGNSFTGWSGDCSGNVPTCKVSMTVPRTVVALFASTPVCTLNPSPSSIFAGGSSTLTASCSPVASSFVWTGGTCAGATAASCTVTPAVTTGYTVAGVNSSGTGPAVGAQVTVTPLAPSCTLAANPSSVNLGTLTPVMLTASCSGSPSSFTWTTPSSAPPAPGTTNVNTANVSFLTTTAQGTYTYSVMATNGGGNSSLASASVTVSTLPAPSCTLAPSPGSVTVGTAANVTLTATCSNAPGSYAWSAGAGSPAVSGTGSQVTASFPASIPAGTYGYSVTATGPGGTSLAANASVTANVPPPVIGGCRIDDFQTLTGYGPGIQTTSPDFTQRQRINQPGTSIWSYRVLRSALPSIASGGTEARYKIDGPGGYTMVVRLSSTPCDFEPESALNYNRFTDYCQMYVGGAGQATTYWTSNNAKLKDAFGNPLQGAALKSQLDYYQACVLPPADAQGYIYFNTRFVDHTVGGPVNPTGSTCVAGVEPNAPNSCSYYLFYE